MNLENCPICKSKDINLYITTFDRHYGYYDKLYTSFKCYSCSVFFLNPMISNDELIDMYDDEYYAYNKVIKHENNLYRKIKVNIRNILLGKTGTMDPVFNNQNELKVLDLGCGSGQILLNMKSRGWQVKGVEVSKKATEVGNEHGLNIFCGTLIEANFSDNEFDYIRSNHSFEHLINPVETIKELYRICKHSGKILIGVPNTNSFAFRLFNKFWYYFGVPFHPFNYNAQNLSLLLERNGFEVLKVSYRSNYRGLLGSLQIWQNDGKLKKSNQGWLINNSFLRIIFQQMARITNFFRIGDCIEIVALKK